MGSENRLKNRGIFWGENRQKQRFLSLEKFKNRGFYLQKGLKNRGFYLQKGLKDRGLIILFSFFML